MLHATSEVTCSVGGPKSVAFCCLVGVVRSGLLGLALPVLTRNPCLTVLVTPLTANYS